MSKAKILLFLCLWAAMPAAMALAVQDTSASIVGRVVDASTQEPIPYALLRIVGTTAGTQTNLDGAYLLKVPTASAGTKIAVSCAGFRSDTLSLRTLRRQKTVKLRPLTVNLEGLTIAEYNKPSSLLKEVVHRLPDNYWIDTAVGTFFFRRYSLTSDSLWLFCEAIADVMRPGYDKQYYRKTGLVVVDLGGLDSIRLAGNHKRYPLGRLPVYDTAMLVRMLGDSVYQHSPFVGASQTVYHDNTAFADPLQSTLGNRWFSGKRSHGIDRHARLTVYDDEAGETFYLITRVTDKDSTALLINQRDKALLHYYHTSLRPDTLMLPFPLNQVLGGVWSPYSRSQYDYAKIGGRYTLVFSMNATAYGVIAPKKSMVGGKINRTIRQLVTDDVVEDYHVWSLIDLQPADHRFLDTNATIPPATSCRYNEIFGRGNSDPTFWQDYNTIPLEARIAEKLRIATNQQ